MRNPFIRRRTESIPPINPFSEVGSITTVGEPGVHFGADDLYNVLLHTNPREFEPVVAEKGSKITILPGYGGSLLLRTLELKGRSRPSHADALQTVRTHYNELAFLRRVAGRQILPNFVSLLVERDPHADGGIVHYMAVERNGNGRTMDEWVGARPGTPKYERLVRTGSTLCGYYMYRPGTDPYAQRYPDRPCIGELEDLCQWSRQGQLYDLDPNVYNGNTSFNVRYSSLNGVRLWVDLMQPSAEQEALQERLHKEAQFVRQFAYR